MKLMLKLDGDDGHMLMTTDFDAAEHGVRNVPTCSERFMFGDMRSYRFESSPTVAVALRWFLMRLPADVTRAIDADVKALMRDMESRATPVVVGFDGEKQRPLLAAPHCEPFASMARKCKGFLRSDGVWSMPFTSGQDIVAYARIIARAGMAVTIDPALTAVLTESLPAPFDGTLDSLIGMPTSVLRVVRGNIQNRAMIAADSSSIEAKLTAMGIRDLHDLILHQPKNYINRSDPSRIADLIPGENATIVGVVREVSSPSARLTVVRLIDSRGDGIDCTFFNANWMRNEYRPGDEVMATGPFQIKDFHGHQYPQLSQPTLDFIDGGAVLPIVPAYSGSTSLNSQTILRCEQELMSRIGDDDLRAPFEDGMIARRRVSDMRYGQAVRLLHFPRTMDDVHAAGDVMAFIELERLMTFILADRGLSTARSGVAQPSAGDFDRAYAQSLPYDLTGAQQRAVSGIAEAMASPRRMHALLVGDVGSGKTTVMHMAALNAVEAGHQAAVVAPTSILADQLYEVFVRQLRRMPANVRDRIHPALHSSYHGRGAAARRRATLAGIADGSINIVFGTHSLLSVGFHDLTFIGVDEQHKFGAVQRDSLLSAREDGSVPDMLMQTATPIPRSMAQVVYGEVSYIALDEMPAGRQPIVTKWVRRKGQQVLDDIESPIWRDVKSEAVAGHGVFVVCPMVNDSEKIAAAGVRRTLARLRSLMGPNVSVEAVYGGQAKDKQDAIIEGFKDGRVSVLVASSVVEVGVSCDLATRMVVLDADRFGIASLHQIRGRIGRGGLPATCWLVAMPFTQPGIRRLTALVDTLDGWKLSKADLRTRGAGSLFGTRQHGRSDLRFADLIVHAKWIEPAREEARAALSGPDGDRRLEEAKRYFHVGDDGMLS
jgi:ATP-dependent DNA helicase RecG